MGIISSTSRGDMPMTFLRNTGAACALLLAAAPPVLAQVKTDGQWRGTAGAAFTTISGNSTSTAFAANAEMLRATTSDKISFGASANYGRSKVNGVNTTTADRWAGFGQYDYNLTSRLFAFGKLGLEGDRLADLDLRSALAGGVGFKVIDTPTTAFSVFGGAAYVTDRYGSPKTVAGKTADSFSRSSLYLGEESSHQLATNTSFKQRLEIYPGLSGDKAVITKFTAGLGVAVSSALNLTVGLTHTDNSKPPLGQKRGDTTLFTGINVKFGAD
jgi:putative salt-induced outer membrane protein